MKLSFQARNDGDALAVLPNTPDGESTLVAVLEGLSAANAIQASLIITTMA